MKQHNLRAYLSYVNVNMNKNKTKQSWMKRGNQERETCAVAKLNFKPVVRGLFW